MKTGDQVNINHDHPAVAAGTYGLIKSANQGPFYGVRIGAGITYMPPEHLEPVGTPEADGNDKPPDALASSAWQNEMAKIVAHSMLKQGEKVRVKKPHAGAKTGDHGKIHSAHHGVYYGVGFGHGVGFIPAANLEQAGTQANPDPDHDNDNDIPGSGANPDAAAWETAMAEVMVQYGQ